MEITLSQFLRNQLGIATGSTKFPLTQVSVFAYREPKSERLSEELSQDLKVTPLFILLILLYSVLKK